MLTGFYSNKAETAEVVTRIRLGRRKHQLCFCRVVRNPLESEQALQRK